MIDKVILLSLFLYITLNLKKIEKFIQSNYNIESFTAKNKNRGNRINEIAMETRMGVGILKLVGMMIGLTIISTKKGDNYVPTELRHAAAPVGTLILIILLVSLWASDQLKDIRTMTLIETFINELSSIVGIYFLVVMGVRQDHAALKGKDFEKFYDAVEKAFAADPKAKEVDPNDKKDDDATAPSGSDSDNGTEAEPEAEAEAERKRVAAAAEKAEAEAEAEAERKRVATEKAERERAAVEKTLRGEGRGAVAAGEAAEEAAGKVDGASGDDDGYSGGPGPHQR